MKGSTSQFNLPSDPGVHGFDTPASCAGKNQSADGAGFHKPGDLENRLGYYLGQPRL